jgi:hypothetical protein
MNHVYHYYAFKDLGSRRLDMDGIVTLAMRVTDLDGFRLIKRTVAEFNHVTVDGVTLASLNYLGECAAPSTQETRPAPPCFWCGCEKEHPDHKFGAGKNHAYRVGSVVTKEEREAYAQNR